MWNCLADDILIRLPVKSTIRFMCVCKSWRSLISSAYFISSHLRKTLASNNSPQIFLYRWSVIDFMGNGLLNFDDPHQDNHFRSMLARLNPQHFRCTLLIVGSINGLICFSVCCDMNDKYIVEFIVFNPEIGCFLSVPTPRPFISDYLYTRGFGFDDTSMDYKIFLAAHSGHCVYLYSLNSNSWTCIPGQDYPWFHNGRSIVFLNGRFYWVSYDYPDMGIQNNPPFIMVFDLKSETFGRISFSKCLLGNLRITKFGESSIGAIQRLRENLTNVWVMEPNESWTKLAAAVWVGKRSRTCLEAQRAVGVRNKDELLVKFIGGGVVSLNVKNRLVRDLKGMEEGDLSVHTHVPSMALLDKMEY